MSDTAATQVTGAEDVVWDLSVFYSGLNDPQIEADREELDRQVDEYVARYKGKLADIDAVGLLAAIQDLEAIYDLQGRLTSFANLVYATNTVNPQYGAFYQTIREYEAAVDQKVVFFRLEWNAVDDDRAAELLADPILLPYRYHLESVRRYQPYQLTEPEEQIVIEKNVTGRQAWVRLFRQLMGKMQYEFEGETLPQPAILAKLHEVDRDVRCKAADSITAGLSQELMTLTYIFNVVVADKAASDKRRGYASWVSSRNLSNKAPDSVVDALVDAVTAQYGLVARHYELKRTLLGYDELYDYDRYAPLPVTEADRFYTWDMAKDTVLKSFEAFSPQMASTAQKFFDGRWIHAPVLAGKRGGAFASPTVPSAHPFVFLNYTGNANSVMTLAHELGHGIHMYLSGQEQGLFGMRTPLTTAEMASVFSEMLVFQDLMAGEPDPGIRLAMLFQKIEDTFATVFRQVAMNRFEHALHTSRREKGELTAETINEFWMETQKAMFQGSVTIRPEYGIWWSYVHHFLAVPGYVYAYAFGELLVLALYEIYKQEGESFAPKYIDLLAAGDSAYPDELLARVGVDLNDPAFWQKGLSVVKDLIDQEEALAREVYPDKF